MEKLWKAGDTVFVVDLHVGRNVEPEIKATKVVKVGRKLITTETGAQYDFSDPDGNSARYAGGGTFHDENERAFRNRQHALEHIERHKLLIMLRNMRMPDITTDQLVRILDILGVSNLPDNPVLDMAKNLINEYCAREFGEDQEGDFSDLRNVGLAYTETEDGKQIQVVANLIVPSIRTYVNGELDTELHYRSLSELIETELKYLSFDNLVCIED